MKQFIISSETDEIIEVENRVRCISKIPSAYLEGKAVPLMVVSLLRIFF